MRKELANAVAVAVLAPALHFGIYREVEHTPLQSVVQPLAQQAERWNWDFDRHDWKQIRYSAFYVGMIAAGCFLYLRLEDQLKDSEYPFLATFSAALVLAGIAGLVETWR